MTLVLKKTLRLMMMLEQQFPNHRHQVTNQDIDKDNDEQ